MHRFEMMTQQLLGLAVPPPPTLPGRIYRKPTPSDEDPGLIDIQHAQIWLQLKNESTE